MNRSWLFIESIILFIEKIKVLSLWEDVKGSFQKFVNENFMPTYAVNHTLKLKVYFVFFLGLYEFDYLHL
jgi:hypothetical protein